MTKYNFKNDYSEGAHNNILKRLTQENLSQEEGYGNDIFCNEAKQLIHKALENNNSDIHFVTGGTQANLIVISSVLRSHESVISASTGHIAVHETGAIEATGHKVNTIKTIDGKLRIQDIEIILNLHEDEHMVKPRLVYISNTTEIGSIYTKQELKKLYTFCQANKLLLYLDGARLGSALASIQNDLKLSDLAKWTDIFYIGGTKNGALIGEAIVINNKQLNNEFRFHIKQKGGLLAKGRIFGIQFSELFKDDLFYELGRHANLMAQQLVKNIKKLNYSFLIESESNQIFPILPNHIIEKLNDKYEFYIWKRIDNKQSIIRLVTSWATQQESIDEFNNDLKKYTLSNA